ncbi:hypothetical protein Gohar_019979, partial [Gossypium harknessii]|nr:hypothetical protein [Gossypium harknessii]
VILIQEQLSKNRIIIDADKKGNINASVTSSSEATKSKTVIQMEKEKIYLLLNQFVKKIPIMVVMKAMGMESDQEVVQMLGRDPRFSALLLPSIERSYADHGEVLYPSQGFSRKLRSFHALLLGSWVLVSDRDMYLTW